MFIKRFAVGVKVILDESETDENNDEQVNHTNVIITRSN